MARKAVLCGVNGYPMAPLRGCINDAENLRSLLIKSFGFRPQEIHLLKDEQVVKPNLRKEWQWLTAGAKAGDTLVFHFSGHGSNVPDRNGDEADRRDEITCLYDMDFNNPASYLSDDEWYDWAQQVNPEAHLIIIKDTCHSGGSSRFVKVEDEAGHKRDILAEAHQLQDYSLGETILEQRVTNARFLVPPDLSAQGRWSGAAATAVINPSRLSEAEPVSLMACQETQTAADAYINGGFNGAFSYYLCQALRSNRQLGTRLLIATVARLLRGKYEQIPQHEGKSLPAPIFGQPARADGEPAAELLSPPQLTTGDLGDSQTTQQMLIQAYLKLLDTVTALQGVTPAVAAPERGTRRVLVTVHGIGSHSAGYSNAWWQALQPHVGTTFDPSELGQGRQEVIWSDLVNRGRSLTRSLDPDEVNRLRQSILDVIEDRREHVAAQSRSLDQMPTLRGSEIAIDDFLVYMMDDDMRRQIIQRLTDVVGPLLMAGATVDIISHSWGTVVAYEGLRELEQRSGLAGRVANWFTVGSALSIAPVQQHLRPANRPTGNRLAPNPALVDAWINLDAQGDLVGGPLSRKFPVKREYLGLPPVTCPRRLWGYDLTCAHSSYFQPANLKVNRDIFAAHILGTARGFEVEDVGELDNEPYHNGAGESFEPVGVDL
jgi:metacaspase-1